MYFIIIIHNNDYFCKIRALAGAAISPECSGLVPYHLFFLENCQMYKLSAPTRFATSPLRHFAS